MALVRSNVNSNLVNEFIHTLTIRASSSPVNCMSITTFDNSILKFKYVDITDISLSNARLTTSDEALNGDGLAINTANDFNTSKSYTKNRNNIPISNDLLYIRWYAVTSNAWGTATCKLRFHN